MADYQGRLQYQRGLKYSVTCIQYQHINQRNEFITIARYSIQCKIDLSTLTALMPQRPLHLLVIYRICPTLWTPRSNSSLFPTAAAAVYRWASQLPLNNTCLEITSSPNQKVIRSSSIPSVYSPAIIVLQAFTNSEVFYIVLWCTISSNKVFIITFAVATRSLGLPDQKSLFPKICWLITSPNPRRTLFFIFQKVKFFTSLCSNRCFLPLLRDLGHQNGFCELKKDQYFVS